MTPASEIIKRLGGFAAVADMVGITRNGVQRWTYPPPRGLGDRVPQEHWTALIKASDGQVALDELMTPEVAEIVEAANAGSA